MRILKHTALLLTLCTPSLTFAAPATNQQVNQLIQILNLEHMNAATLKQIRPQLDMQAYTIVKNIVKSDQLTPEQQNIANELADALYQQSEKTASWQYMKPVYQKIYKEVYTAEEVQAQIDFYKTKVGQSILRKSPQVAEEALKILNLRFAETLKNTEKDMAPIQQKLEQLKKK